MFEILSQDTSGPEDPSTFSTVQTETYQAATVAIRPGVAEARGVVSDGTTEWDDDEVALELLLAALR